MINLNKHNNYYLEKWDDDFFLFRNNYSIMERFGVWGTKGSDSDPQRTKHTIYHNIGVNEKEKAICNVEGIEIVWNHNPLNLIREDDYYKKIK